MYIHYNDLCSMDFLFSDIVCVRMNKDKNIVYNYETNGRTKHLLFCQLKGKRHYYMGEKHLCTLCAGDVLFLPHGFKYRSFITEEKEANDGIGISFNIVGNDGKAILIDEGIKHIKETKEKGVIKRFRQILYSVLNPTENVMKLKGEMYLLLDELIAEREKREDFDEFYKDIMDAINFIENNPENNLSVKELAHMCHMSESSFLRKFKDYSGGIAPVKYRNNIRFMLAEELASSHLTMNEIAEKLGFFDGAHLCKMYKKEKGYSLKRKL